MAVSGETGGCKGAEKISRRSFLNYILSAGGAALAAATLFPVIRYILPPKGGEVVDTSVAVGRASEIAANSAKTFRFGNKPAMLIRTSEGTLKAFSAVCTHLNCTVQYDSRASAIVCACHNGHFDLNGQVISGPPPKPLEAFRVDVRDDNVTVSKIMV